MGSLDGFEVGDEVVVGPTLGGPDGEIEGIMLGTTLVGKEVGASVGK